MWCGTVPAVPGARGTGAARRRWQGCSPAPVAVRTVVVRPRAGAAGWSYAPQGLSLFRSEWVVSLSW